MLHYDVCRLWRLLHYDICHIIMVVAYECVAYRVCCSAYFVSHSIFIYSILLQCSVRRKICYVTHRCTLLGETYYYYATNHILSGGTVINTVCYCTYHILLEGILLLSYILVPYFVRRNIIIILHTRTIFCQEEYYNYPTYWYHILSG